MRPRSAVLLLLACLGVAIALRLLPAAVVEAGYARGAYPVVLGLLSPPARAVPFALTEPGAVLVALVGLGLAVRTRLGRSFWLGLVGVAGAGWLVFQAVWGVNYHREPIARSLGLDVHPSAPAELLAFSRALVAEAGARRPAAPAPPAEVALADAAALYAALPGSPEGPRWSFLAPAARAAPAKPLVASELLSWLGLLGFYDPFLAEPNVNVRAPGTAIPFVALHEMAHQRGVASEDEASFVAIVLGRDLGPPHVAYSCLWEATLHTLGALAVVDPAGAKAVWADADGGLVADVEAWRAWRLAHASPLEGAARTVNDTYLRSQGVHDGVESYGRVVDLLLAEWRAAGGR